MWTIGTEYLLVSAVFLTLWIRVGQKEERQFLSFTSFHDITNAVTNAITRCLPRVQSNDSFFHTRVYVHVCQQQHKNKIQRSATKNAAVAKEH